MTFGTRLKEERNRLGMSQTVFATHGGVVKFSQIKYEKDESTPSVDYLFKIEAIGVDIGYVLTGDRQNPNLIARATLDERTSQVVSRWNSLGEPAKVLVEKTLELLPAVEAGL